MPDKRYKRGCGRRCLCCWQNKLKHGCPSIRFANHAVENKKEPVPGYIRMTVRIERKRAQQEKRKERKDEKRSRRALNQAKKDEREFQTWLTVNCSRPNQ